MIVWRIQDKDGYGPYRSVRPPGTLFEFRLNEQPSPAEDFSVFRPNMEDGSIPEYGAICDLLRGYMFGFPSVHAATRWFNEDEMDVMAALGYFLTAVEVPDNLVVLSDSGRQCMFPKNAWKVRVGHLDGYQTQEIRETREAWAALVKGTMQGLLTTASD